MRLLILGSKEFPFGINENEDILPSGGLETFVHHFSLLLRKKMNLIVVTRRFKKSKKNYKGIKIVLCPWLKGYYLRAISFHFFSFFLCLNQKFDCILSMGTFGNIVGIILSKLKQKPLIIRTSGFPFEQPQYSFFLRRFLFFIEKQIYRSNSYFIFSHNADKVKTIKQFQLNSIKFTIIPNSINIEDLKKFKVNKLHKRIKILFLGRLIGVKGPQILIESLKNISSVDYSLDIIGNGPLFSYLKLLVKQNQLDSYVTFYGYQYNPYPFFARSNIFILPSISEGFPVALLEAMYFKNACIITDIGLPFKKGFHCIIIPPNDSIQLGKAIDFLINNKKIREEISGKAYIEIIKNYTWDSTKYQYLNYLRYVRRNFYETQS